jgi:hypothetical protein
MHVSNEKEAAMLLLHADEVLYCSKIITNMQITCTANAAYYRFHAAKLIHFIMNHKLFVFVTSFRFFYSTTLLMLKQFVWQIKNLHICIYK